MHEIRYFSMFSGVGGFEIGLEAASYRNGEDDSQETNSQDTSGNQSIPQREQNRINKQTDSGDIEPTNNSSGTLLPNRQEQSNTKSKDMDEIEFNSETRRPLRRTSDGVLRERSRIRNDSESLQFGEYSTNTIKSANNPQSLPPIEQDQQRRNGPTDEQGTLLRDRQSPSFTCVGMSEWDKYSSQVLKYRFPKVKNWGDCTKIQPEILPDFDMLCGGFPCQAFSIAGKRRGFEDIRGTMFFEVARILKVKRPKIILLENVKGLLNHDKGQTFRVILQTLDELGYEVQWMVLNSKFHGVPQNRERVLIIGNLRGEPRPEILPFGENDCRVNESNEETTQTQITPTIDSRVGAQTHRSPYIKVEGMLTEDGWDKRHENIRRVYSTEGISPTIPTGQGGGVMPKIRAVLTPDRAEKRQNGRRFKEPGEPSFTCTGQDIHGVTDGKTIRRLTPVECERLQGFPDGWTEYGTDEKGERVKMSDTQRYKQMGNAVTTNVIQAVGSKLWQK